MFEFEVGDMVGVKNTPYQGVIKDVLVDSIGGITYIVEDFFKERKEFDEYLLKPLKRNKEVEKIKTLSRKMTEELGGTKFDSGKPDLSLVDRTLVEAAARSLSFGAKKYGRNNYKKGIEMERIYASLLRHIFARMSGELNDPESGLDHIDHIAANVQFLAYFVDKEVRREYTEDNKGENI